MPALFHDANRRLLLRAVLGLIGRRGRRGCSTRGRCIRIRSGRRRGGGRRCGRGRRRGLVTCGQRGHRQRSGDEQFLHGVFPSNKNDCQQEPLGESTADNYTQAARGLHTCKVCILRTSFVPAPAIAKRRPQTPRRGIIALTTPGAPQLPYPYLTARCIQPNRYHSCSCAGKPLAQSASAEHSALPDRCLWFARSLSSLAENE